MTIQIMSAKVDLHYSPDERGWYFQEYDAKFQDRISQLFPSKSKALEAWHSNKIKWHKL